MPEHCFALEYARGNIPAMLPFGLIYQFTSILDPKTVAKTLRLYTQAAAGQAAAADRQRLQTEAELEVERFKTSAMSAAQREVDTRKAELEHEVVDRAIARATKLLQAKLTEAPSQPHGRRLRHRPRPAGRLLTPAANLPKEAPAP